jgi:hypothetical protein
MTATSYRALLRSLLRQPNLTSDALLIVADGLDATEHPPGADAEEAVRVARLMRALAPAYTPANASWPLDAAPEPPPNSDAAIKALLDVYPASPRELRIMRSYASYGSRAAELLDRILYWADQRNGRILTPAEAAEVLMRRYAPGDVVAPAQQDTPT